jgi:phosphatidylglycerophosphate synthase
LSKFQKVTVADVRYSLNPNIKAELMTRWFGRPLANLLTPAFHNSGWTANRVTYLRMVIAIVGVSLLAIPEPALWPVAGMLYLLCFVLDFVDGNLSRLQKDVTYYGKFIDGVGDLIYLHSSAFMAGIGVWLYFGEPAAVVVGGAVSALSVTYQMMKSRLSFFREWMVSQTGALTDLEIRAAAGPRKIQSAATGLMVTGYFAAHLSLLYPEKGILIFLAMTVLFQGVLDVVQIAATLIESSCLLRRNRRSVHSRVEETSSLSNSDIS